jgi:predicted hotdog family 3-hydroxylacyl-ACP dehydratase
MLYQGDEIKQLIPQREPIIMVEDFVRAEGDEAETGLTIKPENIFVENGHLVEAGLIEHIAQSASAFAGYRAISQGQPVPLGYIGEVKKFRLHRYPQVGQRLTTLITMGTEVNGITLLRAETRVGEDVVADTTMKIFVEP